MEKEKQYHSQHYINEILKHCVKFGIPIDDKDENGKYKTIRQLTGFSIHQLFNNKTGFNDSEEQQQVFTIDVVKTFYFACGVNPTVFLRKPSQEKKWFELREASIAKENNDIEKHNTNLKNGQKPKKKKAALNRNLYFTNTYWQEIIEPHFSAANSIIKYIRIHSHDANSNLQLEEVYEKILAPYFLNAAHTIKIYEVLFKGTNRQPNENMAYQEAQHHVLEAIQDWLDNMKDAKKPYKYIRTFACSRSTYIFRKDGKDNLKQAMVLEASARTIEHLNYCFKEHSKNCEFYVTTTKRLRNHALIDDEYSLTEDYYTTPDNIVVPDGIFINDVCLNSKTHPFKQALEKETFEGIRFTKSNLRKYLIDGYFLIIEKSKEKLNIADRIRNELDLDDLADDEQDKGEILKKYKNIVSQKITDLGWTDILKEEIRERKKLKT